MKTRDTLWVLSFCGFGVNYMLRININIAIVEMVGRRTANEKIDQAQCYTLNHTVQFMDSVNGTENPTTAIKYDWDEYEQNLVLSSYYWMHWITQLPGGLLAHHYGSKKVVGLSNFLVALLTFAVPISTYFSLYTLVAIRFLQGTLAGAMWPAMHSMVSKWIPPVERGKFLSSYLGSSAGAAFTYFICGYIIDWYGWENVFYITGTLGTIWYLTWVVIIYDTPQNHPWISDEERAYIEESIGSSLNKEKLPIPWKSILTSKYVWINMISQWGAVGGNFALLTHTPTYLKFIHGIQVKSNGVLSGLPHLTRSIFAFVFGVLNQYQTCMSEKHFRKLSSGLCTIGVGFLTLCLAFSGCSTEIAIILLFVTITLQGTMTSGPYASVVDMTPNFSSMILTHKYSENRLMLSHSGLLTPSFMTFGIVQGMTGGLAVMTGFIYPSILGYLTQNNQTLVQWQKYFFIVAGICIGCGLLDCLYGSSELQPWNSSQPKHKEMKPLKKNKIIIS